jgi:copper(I)-binding protein
MRRLLATAALFATLAFGAVGQATPSISLDNAWARATMTAAQTGVVYLTITGHGAPDRLIGASTPVAGKAELHQTIRDGAVMKMRPVAGLVVSPNAPITLSPGGYHLMLTELKQPLTGGQTFPLTLTFEKAGSVQTTVTVKATGASAAMDMGGAGQDMQQGKMPGMPKP